MEIKPFERYLARAFCFDIYNILGKYFISLNEKNSRISGNGVITREKFVSDINDYLKNRGNPFSELQDAERCIQDGFVGHSGDLKIIRGEKLEKKLVEEMERDRSSYFF